MNNIKNNKKIIILALVTIVIIGFLSALFYIFSQKNSKIKIPEPSSLLSKEEEILRALAPLTAPKLSAEELAKEKATLKQLSGKTKKLSPSDVEKEKELLKFLSAPSK